MINVQGLQHRICGRLAEKQPGSCVLRSVPCPSGLNLLDIPPVTDRPDQPQPIHFSSEYSEVTSVDAFSTSPRFPRGTASGSPTVPSSLTR